MIARPGPARTAVGFGVAAFPVTQWVTQWYAATMGPGGTEPTVTFALAWLPAVVVGSTLGWCGLRDAPRILAWVADLAILWWGSALVLAVQVVAGSRVLLGQGREAAYAFFQYLGAGLSPAGMGLRLAGVAVLIALLVMAARRLLSPGTPPVPEQPVMNRDCLIESRFLGDPEWTPTRGRKP